MYDRHNRRPLKNPYFVFVDVKNNFLVEKLLKICCSLVSRKRAEGIITSTNKIVHVHIHTMIHEYFNT